MTIKSQQKEKADSIYFHIIKDLENGDYSTAKIQLGRLKKLEEKSARIIDIEGLFAFADRRFDEAEKLYLEAVGMAPDAKQYKLNLGNLYMAKEDWEKAVETYKAITAKEPLYFPAVNNLAMALIRLDKKDEALEVIEDIKKLKSNYPMAYRMEAIIWYEKGDYEKALKAADKNIILDPNNPETFEILGQIFNRQEKFEDAVIALKRAVDLDPDNTDNMVSLGLAYGNIKQFDLAKPVFEKVVSRDPSNETALKGLQLIYTLEGNMEKAYEFEKRADSVKK